MIRAGDEALGQRFGEHEIRHVVEREGALEAVRREGAAREDRARIVDQHVDARRGCGDLAADALGFGQAGEVGIVNSVAETRRRRVEPGARRLAAAAVACDDDHPRAHRGEAYGGDLADAGGCAGDHHGLAVHAGLLLACQPQVNVWHRVSPTRCVLWRHHDWRMTEGEQGMNGGRVDWAGRLALVLCALTLALPACAADYPTRPVRIIVPYGPGGIADVTMRLTAQKLSERLGQQFIIDNRPGAGGVVGARAAASAAPDGYTLGMIGGGLTIAKSLFKSLPYDLVNDFIPISTTAFYGLVVAAKADSGLKSVGDVIAAARAKPGKLNFGTINPGSNQHLAAELFRTLAQIKVTMVPYKTTPDLITALLRGDVDVVFEYEAGLGAMMTDPRVKLIAYTGPQRLASQPTLPTVAESGLPGYDVTSWNGLAAPKGTPRDIVEKLSREVTAAVSQPDGRAAMAKFGMEARGSTSEDLRARIKTDIAKWAEVIEKAGIPKK